MPNLGQLTAALQVVAQTTGRKANPDPNPVSLASSGGIIEARDIGMTYGPESTGLRAVDHISFSLADGEFKSVVGPSGCGKSTLLQILGGLVRPTNGEVLIDGRPMHGPAPGQIAIVFQDALLLPWKSSLENVEFPLELQGISRSERRKRALEMLALVGLKTFADRRPHELSGGMRQRVSIARALAQTPRIILMDEPFGALDEQTRLKMGRELLRIWDLTKTSILFVTHSLTESLYLSDKVIVMGRYPGRILETIDVGLPRPRTIDMIGSEQFGKARNHLWDLLTIDEEDGSHAAPEL